MNENRIGSERVKMRLTQSSIADKLAVSSRTVQLWEKDATKCPSKKLCALSDLFSVTVDYLLGLTEKRN